MALSVSPAFSKDFYIEVRAMLSALKDANVVAGSDTVTTVLATLITERDKQ